MLNEGLLESGVSQEICFGRIVGGDQGVVGSYAVAGVRKPLPVIAGLRPIFGDRVAGEPGPAGPQPGQPTNHWDGQHGLSTTILALSYKVVRRTPGGGRTIIETFKIPVCRMIVSIKLPIVARLGIASRTVQRRVEIRELVGSACQGVRTGEGGSVDERIDGVPIR